VRSSSPLMCSSRIIIVSITLLLLATLSYGQGSSRSPGTLGNRQKDMQSREWALTHVSDEVSRHFGPQNKPSLPQMREDFHQLQVVNNELMKSVFVKNSIDPKRILASMIEIRKRATRLKSSLALGESEELDRKINARNGTPPEKFELSPTLLLLDRAVMNFVNNPLFHQPKVLDSKLAIQAENELGEILRLAEAINRLTKHTEAQK
jgi:hypothetical protein